MRRWNIKPFTLFLILISLFFLIAYPIWFGRMLQKPSSDPLQKELPSWTGVITLWDIPYVQAGKGSHLQWLKNCINRFEKEHPGVFIDVRTMTIERLNMYLYGDVDRDILPDIISLGIYEQPLPEELLTDLSHFFDQDELAVVRDPALKRVQYNERILGLPFMMGCYGLYVNQNALTNELEWESGTLDNLSLDSKALNSIARKNTYTKEAGKQKFYYYGFCTYSNSNSKPLLSMIYQEDGIIRNTGPYAMFREWMEEEQDIMPPNMESLSYSSAFRLFALEGRAAIMLGSSKVLFDMRNLQASGKGIEYKVYPIPGNSQSGLYTDQIAAYGLLNQANQDKEELCILFLKSLLQEEMQMKLQDIGMFSVLDDLRLYEDDADMQILERSLNHFVSGPWTEDGKKAEDLLNILYDGNNEIET